MTGPIDPGGRAGLRPDSRTSPERRTGDRREGRARREGEAVPTKALVPSGERRDHPVESPAPETASPSAFAAQVIGQTGQRKGLKGGPPVLDSARGAYLDTEYAGKADRRPKPGKTASTDV